MRPLSFICHLLLPVCLTMAPAAFGQLTTDFNFNNVNLAISDNNPNGVQNSQTIAGLSGSIVSLQVSLDIAGTGFGAFNGDYYVELVNGAGSFAVLLNRTGVSSANSLGYGDNGFDVTFADMAPDNIHFYQNFSYNLNPNGQLTGIWQPDGENISPLSNPSAFNSATQNQTAILSSFDGDSPNDTWTLFAADLSQGGTGQLVSWSLEITTVPEPQIAGLIATGLILYVCFGQQTKMSADKKSTQVPPIQVV
jgi:subtilisin-like proprotein convertase family protein